MQKLLEFDHWLFKKINSEWTNSFFDFIFPFFRQPYFWVPLYIFILALVILNDKKNGPWWILFFICTVAVTDMTGTFLFKENFQRIRPCNNPLLASFIRILVKDCPSGYGFTSNHAANHFGMAVFFFITMRKSLGKWCWLAVLWAFSISYAQIYVGVHYPADVAGGTILGVTIGSITALFFKRRFGFVNFDRQPTVTT